MMTLQSAPCVVVVRTATAEFCFYMFHYGTTCTGFNMDHVKLLCLEVVISDSVKTVCEVLVTLFGLGCCSLFSVNCVWPS